MGLFAEQGRVTPPPLSTLVCVLEGLGFHGERPLNLSPQGRRCCRAALFDYDSLLDWITAFGLGGPSASILASRKGHISSLPYFHCWSLLYILNYPRPRTLWRKPKVSSWCNVGSKPIYQSQPQCTVVCHSLVPPKQAHTPRAYCHNFPPSPRLLYPRGCLCQ